MRVYNTKKMENNKKQQSTFSKYEKIIFLVIGFLLTSVVGGALGQHFQNRTWHQNHKDFHQHSEKESARTLFDELSITSGTRLYQMKRYLWAIEGNMDKAIQKERWILYQGTLNDWNYNLLRNMALLEYSFGEDMRKIFNNKIQRKFGELHTLLNEGTNNDKAAKLANELSDELNHFNIKMVSMIQKVQVGQFIDPDGKGHKH